MTLPGVQTKFINEKMFLFLQNKTIGKMKYYIYIIMIMYLTPISIASFLTLRLSEANPIRATGMVLISVIVGKC